MSGPLPKPAGQRRRRNAPTIPTTELPAEGRKGPAPKCPKVLGKPGKAWWSWAWKLPQALGWSSGDLYALARRAELEDVLEVLDAGDQAFDLADYLDLDADLRAANQRLRSVIGTLRAQAGNRSSVVREMRELDDRFGLTPKGFAALRWRIVEKAEEPEKQQSAAPSAARRRHLMAVGAAAQQG